MKEGGFASSVPAIAANIDAWRKRKKKKKGVSVQTRLVL
jgi:hypothetical protein